MHTDLLKNAEEFLASGDDNLKKKRFNAAVADFFKAIAILCDYLIYEEMKIKPKNHSDRFSLLRKYFSDIYQETSDIFKVYTMSYNLRLSEKDAEKLRDYAYGLKNRIFNKK